MLSLIAFAGGASSACRGPAARVDGSGPARPGQRLHPAHPGHAAADPAVPVLLRPAASWAYKLDPLVAAGLSLTIYAAAFLGEIWRGCIEAVPQDAVGGRGLPRPQPLPAAAYVILPQAVRIAIPPTVGFMVQIVKNTSLASVIGFVELTRAGQIVNNSTFEPFVVFMHRRRASISCCAIPLSLASPRARKEAPCRSLSRHRRDHERGQGVRAAARCWTASLRRRRAARSSPSSAAAARARARCCAASNGLETDPGRRIEVCGHDGRPAGQRRPAPAAPRRRHGVPELQPVPAPHRRAEHHAGAHAR